MWSEPPPVSIQANANACVQLPDIPLLDQIPDTRKETKIMTIGAGFVVKQETFPEPSVPKWSFIGRSAAASSVGTPKAFADEQAYSAAPFQRSLQQPGLTGMTSAASAPTLLPAIQEKTLLTPLGDWKLGAFSPVRSHGSGGGHLSPENARLKPRRHKTPAAKKSGVLDYQTRGFLPEIDELRQTTKAVNKYADVPSRINTDSQAEKREQLLQQYLANKQPLLKAPAEIVDRAMKKGINRHMRHANGCAQRRATERARATSQPLLPSLKS
eukprot:TRINITY_DN39369_c0_g1_i1.p2 TRINITY_DN39369_c0_g1~~TRINITY_DN39369_c0_g1_i1.p2  ORF type:complete len:270 (+),score=75.84 TRINITY_DN39369_c0_g1_i1:86-895(+)